jgi:hypothetical protein
MTAARFPDTTRVYAFEAAPGDGLVRLCLDPAAPRTFHLDGALLGTIEARRWADAHRALMARAAEAGFGPGRLVRLARAETARMVALYKTEEWKAQARALKAEDDAQDEP